MTSSPAAHPAYTLLKTEFLPLWNATGSLYLHRSGARVLSISCADDNKTFGIFFPTLPYDHTGLPHILEHCVLSGSEKYPVKEPFKELIKTSLQTYLNAYTYPDRTCYPVASRNLRDYHNLVDVYLDAVFFPRLTPEVLGQEGWRPQWNRKGELEIQGVVYNEMKGVYASPDARLQELEQHCLYPDTLYRFDYGGSPAHIPDLDHDRFVAFHRTYYNAANAFVGFYGDDDPLQRLEKLDEVLSRVPPGEPAALPELQAGWGHTRRVQEFYPASEEGDEGVFCQLNWLLPGLCSDTLAGQNAALVAQLLLQSPASPLRLALLESDLGEDVLGHVGLHLRQPSFSAGLRGVEPENTEKVFALILETLEQLARDNFRPDLIEGCLNTTEFNMREMNTSARGLTALNTALFGWMQGCDPLDTLRPEQRVAHLRQTWEQNPRCFADWIRDNLLNNPQRCEIVLAPDVALEEKEAEQEQDRLRALAAQYAANADANAEAQALATAVERFQNTPDSPESLAMLPRLQLDDVTPPSPGAPLETGTVEGVDVWTSPVDSAGILYVNLAFDIHSVPLEDLPLLPLYGRCLTELGAGDLGHLAFNEQVACHTGGISQQFETAECLRPGETLAAFLLHGKCLRGKIPQLFRLLADLLRAPHLGPAERVRQLLLEEKANEEADLVQRGNRVVTLRLRAALSSMERPIEEMGGISYLQALRRFENCDAEKLVHRLRDLHARIVRRSGFTLHFGGDPDCIQDAQREAQRILDAVPAGDLLPRAQWPLLPAMAEGLVVASPVHFVGLATRLPVEGEEVHASMTIAKRLLGTDYLWERVRMKGGAYGVSWTFNPGNGHCFFSSYRDPQVHDTLNVYRASADWLRALDLTTSALEQVKIGAMGAEPPRKPSRDTYQAFYHRLVSLTHARRIQRWEQMRATEAKDLRHCGDLLRDALAQQQLVSVLGGKSGLSASATALQLIDVMG
jgi:Zn-dependent M16 (insulinase) family peptidase